MFQTIEEHVVEGRRLGRHVNHDPRSLQYLVKPRASLAQSKSWDRKVPVFDQGNLGSCTGNATAGVLGTDPYFATLPAGITLDENEAVALYESATVLDNYPGSYPPDDTGSDGLSVAKAAQKAGLISGYVHCTSLDAVITALQTGPVITGVNWYDSFDSPDASGKVSLSPNAQRRGGHEFEVFSVDIANQLLGAWNSWGPSWGLSGKFFFSFADYDRLLNEQGDATQFVPLTSPAPVPTPTPTPPLPSDIDAALIHAMDPWASSPHMWHKAVVAAKAYKQWKIAHNY